MQVERGSFEVAHRHHDRGRVDPAGERRSHRHVAAQVQPHALDEHLAQARRGGVEGQVRACVEVDVPVAGRLGSVGPVDVDRQQVRRRELAHAGEHRLGVVVRQAEAQVVVQAPRIGPRRQRGHVEQGTDLRGERQALLRGVVVQRLDAEDVARQHEPPFLHVEDREREHPDEPGQGRRSPGGPRSEQDLGVPGRDEAPALGGERRAQLAVVVDLPVEHEVEPAIGRRHRLPRGGGQVEDRKAPVGQGDSTTERDPGVPTGRRVGVAIPAEEPHVVGTAVGETLRGDAQALVLDRPVGPQHDSGDAAHVRRLRRALGPPGPGSDRGRARPRARAPRGARWP